MPRTGTPWRTWSDGAATSSGPCSRGRSAGTSRTGCSSRATTTVRLPVAPRVRGRPEAPGTVLRMRPVSAAARRLHCPCPGPHHGHQGGSGMLQRFFGVSIGALITFLLLLFFIADRRRHHHWRFVGDANQAYIWAAIIGAVASFFWPIVIAWFLVRRRKARQRRTRSRREVERQMAEQQNPGSRWRHPCPGSRGAATFLTGCDRARHARG